jgi:hypothetical protein
MNEQQLDELASEAFEEIEDVERRIDSPDVAGTLGFVRLFIDALTGKLSDTRRDLAISREQEKTALRRGFKAGIAINDIGGPLFADWSDYEKHLAELEEHEATLARIAEAEENKQQ